MRRGCPSCRDPDTYERYEKVIVVHGVRHVADLAYQEMLEKTCSSTKSWATSSKSKLIYYPTVTREPFRNQGRISDQIENGTFPQNIGLPPLNRETDRVMLCGSPEMLDTLKHMFEARGFNEGNTTTPGDFVIERAFVEINAAPGIQLASPQHLGRCGLFYGIDGFMTSFRAWLCTLKVYTQPASWRMLALGFSRRFTLAAGAGNALILVA